MKFNEAEKQLNIGQSMQSKKLNIIITRVKSDCYFSILVKTIKGFTTPVFAEDIYVYRTINDWEYTDVASGK